MRGSREEGPLVVFQGFQPRRDIGGMFLAGLRGQLKIGADERRAKLGDLSEQSSCLSGLSSAETSRSGGVARF